MKKALSLLFCILCLSNVFPQMVTESFAQFFKVDITKTPSKLSNWFQTQKAKCEKMLEGVQTSQFGQFIGDGIKYTKEGMAYATDLQEKAMDLYGEVKDATINSPEYKTGIISKEIAQESQKLKDLQEDKLKKQEEIQAQIDLLKEQASAKISNVQQNIKVLEQKGNIATAKDSLVSKEAEDDLPKIRDEELEKTPEMLSIEQEIKQIQDELAMQQEDYESELEIINEEYEEKIRKQSEKIAELTQELSEIAKSNNLFTKKNPKASSETLQETQEEFLLSKAPSIREENQIKTQRKDALSEIIVEVSTIKADKQLARATAEEKTRTTAELEATMPGESEGSGVSAEVLSEQLQVLRSYIDIVLADLKLQAAIEVNNLRRINSAPLKEKFNLCNYTDSSNVGSEGKKTAQALFDINSVEENSARLKANIGTAVNQAKGVVREIKGQYQQVEEIVDNKETIMDQYNNIDPSTIGVF